MEDIPTVEPIDIPQYKYKNSKYEILPKLPATMIAVASSTGGKSVLIQNIILKIYRGSFECVSELVKTCCGNLIDVKRCSSSIVW